MIETRLIIRKYTIEIQGHRVTHFETCRYLFNNTCLMIILMNK